MPDLLQLPAGAELQHAHGLEVVELEGGGSPLDSAIELGVGEPVETSSISSNDTSMAPVQLTPVIHVCGNGKRSSAEACDDNNTNPLDGCDALCRVETGWSCVPAIFRDLKCLWQYQE